MNALTHQFTTTRRMFCGEQIVDIAKRLVGIHYERYGRGVLGTGLDCVGLVERVAEEIGDPLLINRDWPEHGGDLRLIEVPMHLASEGDVLVFDMLGAKRWFGRRYHMALLSTGDTLSVAAKIVHAYDGHAATESWLNAFFGPRLIRAYRFGAKLEG